MSGEVLYTVTQIRSRTSKEEARMGEILSGAGSYWGNVFDCSVRMLLFLFPFCVTGAALHWISRKLASLLLDLHGPWFLLMTAPGVALHELGHWVFAGLFFRRIGKVVWFQAESTLGYVKMKDSKLTVCQGIGDLFIAAGPILIASAFIVLLTKLLLPAAMAVPLSGSCDLTGLLANAGNGAFDIFKGLADISLLANWKTWVWLIAVTVIVPHIGLSRSDLFNFLWGVCSYFCFLVPAILVWSNFGSPGDMLPAQLGGVLTAGLTYFYFVTGVTAVIFLLHAAIALILKITGKHPHWVKTSPATSSEAPSKLIRKKGLRCCFTGLDFFQYCIML